MKKVIAALFAVSLASAASAGTVSVEFGTNWYKVNHTNDVYDNLIGQGQNFLVSWSLDNDLSLGAYSEAGTWLYDSGSSDTWELTAIQVSKGVVKNVAVGMNIGRMYQTYDSGGGYDGMLTDVFGSVVILSGSGDKVSGVLKTVVGGRFAAHYASGDDFSGITVNLVVGLQF